MRVRIMLATLALLAVSTASLAQPAAKTSAAKTPEQMLPAECLFYFRYDGYEPHRNAYDKTALAKVMKEGLSDFFDHLLAQASLFAAAGAEIRQGNLPKGQGKPDPEVSAFLDCLSQHGFAAGLQVAPAGRGQTLTPENIHLTVVFPGGATKKRPIEKFFEFLARKLERPVLDVKQSGRIIHSIEQEEIQLAWWAEGEHVVLSLGKQAAQKSLRVIDGRQSNASNMPWFKELAGFKRYETDMRGYIDLAAVVEHVTEFGLGETTLEKIKNRFTRQVVLRHLGLTGLKNATFLLGFDGKYQRSTIRVAVVEPARRTGLLILASGPLPFAADKLPVMPPDTDYVSVTHVDWNNLHDYVRTSYGLLAMSRLVASGEIPGRFPDLNRLVGGDFRKDLLDQLDSTVISYGGHSEGPFFLGQGFAIKVKDEEKVRKSLVSLAEKVSEIKEVADFKEYLKLQKTVFRGQPMYCFNRVPYFPLSFTVHKGWLVAGLYPQTVQGYLLRSGGNYRVWKAPPELAEALAKERKENGHSKLLGVNVSDPRPAITIGLSLMPVFFQMAGLSSIQVVDVSKIPNSQAINEWLFPNVRLFFDDGNALRWENHYSINEPDDILLLGMSSYQIVEYLPNLLRPRRNEPAPAVIAAPLPAVMPLPPLPVVQPQMCPATATEADGKVTIQLTAKKQIPYQIVKKVAEEVVEAIEDKGVVRTVKKTVYKDVTYTEFKSASQSISICADGKTVRVTRKDGKPVDPKELPKLLAKETQVLYVADGEIDAARLERLDGNTLIIRTEPGAELPKKLNPDLPLPTKSD
jgi:hypothetical protein